MAAGSRDELVEENRQLRNELARLRQEQNSDPSIKLDCETGRCPLAPSTHAILWKLDCKTQKFTFISPQIEQWMGYPAQSWIGLETCRERVHPDDKQIIDRLSLEAISLQHNRSFGYRIIAADNSVIWVRDVVSVKRAGDTPQEIFGFMIDMTETRQIETSLRESEARYKALFEQTADYVLVLDPSQGDIPIIVDGNEAAFKKHGYSRDELIGQPISMLDARLSPKQAEKRAQKTQSGQLIHFEAEHRRKDGTIFFVDVALQKVTIAGKSLIYAVERDITEYKRAQENLQFTQFASDHAPESIIWINEQAKICYANQAACRDHGYNKRELLSMSILELNPTVTHEQWLSHWQELKQQGSIHFKTSHQRKDGSIFPIEVSANLVCFAEREYNVGFIRNISERTQIEAEKQSHIRALESLQRISDIINSPVSSDKTLDLLVATIRELFSADRAWLLTPCDPDADFWEIPVEATAAEYPGIQQVKQKMLASDASTRIFRDALNSDRPVIYCPMINLDADMEQFAVQSQIMIAIHPKHGEPWLLGLHQCSHERVWSSDDQELLASIAARITDLLNSIHQDRRLHHLSAAVEQAGESVMITDRQGTIEYVNPAFTAITGYESDEVLGKDPSILKSNAQDSSYYRDLWTTISRGDIWTGTLIDRKKDGSCYPALMNVAPIFDDQGNITHFVATQQDTTELRQLEEQFFEAQKLQAIGTLAGGIAHDFNNMLATIQGNTFLARRYSEDNPDLNRHLDTLDVVVERAATMVKQLLTYARKDRVSKVPFSLNAFMAEGFKMVKSTLPENIEHVCDLCQDELIINGDATQLQQALMNLLINARDAVAGSPQPKITCSLSPFTASDAFLDLHPELHNTHFARLTVRDNGCGITRNKLNHIFEPFFTTKEVGKGTGLGLAMVEGSIKTHGGTVEVESEADSGTAFHVYLPLSEQQQTMEERVRAAPLNGKAETILLVDDEETLRTVISEVLESLGYTVLQAGNGKDALSIVASQQINLVITDIIMPEMGGIELAHEIRKLQKSTPIIFVTGYDREQALVMSEEIKHSLILNKPFEFESLSQTIRKLLS